MRHWRAEELWNKGIEYESFNLNKLIKYPSEHLQHFLVKAQVFYILREMKHDVLTEFRIRWINNGNGYGIGDVLDISSYLPRHYEIETSKSKKYHEEKVKQYIKNNLDIIIVDVNKLPSDEFQRYRFLRDMIIIDDKR